MTTTRIRRPCPAKRHVPHEEFSTGNGMRNWVFEFPNGYTVDLVRSPMTHGLEAALIRHGKFVRFSGLDDWFDQDGMCRPLAREVDNLLDYVKALPIP